ncbi:MAG: methyltransferase domain-containing protein [Candidatus Omnitrophica bacterium]|nr:methyltransferase domain-containing protein [Candidatus Omnitrophota bacterium]
MSSPMTHMLENMEIFICPICSGGLEMFSGAIRCKGCGNNYRFEGGVPLLFWPNDWDESQGDVTSVIKSFYEKTPFPNYDDLEDAGDLVNKAEKGFFARMLNEQIPFNIRVLEVGCGTGQLSNFLGIANRRVFGADICLNSLRLAQEFKEKNDLRNAGFYQMNLFRPIFKEKSFPLVICNGVLHHTSDPFLGFKSIAGLVKKGGFIMVGLYNRYGRLATDIQRLVFSVFGEKSVIFDKQLKRKDTGGVKKNTWFLDQYKNPHESKHTVGEVLRWFDQTGFDFVNSIPKITFEPFSEKERLFRASPRGNALSHFTAQGRLVFTGHREGGLFLMIGKRRLNG